jgi:hypothetical protein
MAPTSSPGPRTAQGLGVMPLFETEQLQRLLIYLLDDRRLEDWADVWLALRSCRRRLARL